MVQLNDSIVPEAKEGEVDEGYKVEIESLNMGFLEKLKAAGAILNESCRLTFVIEGLGHTDKTKDKRFSAILLIVIISVSITGCSNPKDETYNKAVKAFMDSDYTTAKALFEQIIDYKDSETYLASTAKAAATKAESDKVAADKAVLDKVAADYKLLTPEQKAAADKVVADKRAAADKLASDKAAADKAAADKVAADKVAAEKIAYDTGITYNQLARTPDNFDGKKVKFTGKVVQVTEGDNQTDLRIAVSGSYDTILYVTYNPKISSVRVLEDDNVTIKGVSQGIYTYKSTIGGSITIPLVAVDIITIN